MSVTLEGIEKRFGPIAVIDDLSVTFAQGAISVLLGPSGCGKTTTLRCIAGLEEPSSGRITVHGQDVFWRERRINLPPEKRNLGMVFQSYAIWPHMSVRENVRLPLKARGTSASEAEKKIAWALETVGLSGLGERSATALSGGQQQRVALARCIASESPVILLDEPLSNLDARLRVAMRGELRELQRRLGTTMIFVTHDQEEAMSLADRIFLFNAGRIEQAGAPLDIYRRPRTRYAAEFFGKVNFVPVTVGASRAGTRELHAANDVHLLADADVDAPTSGRALCAIRPEAWRLAPSPSQGIPGRVVDAMHHGDRVEYRVETPLGMQLVTQLGGTQLATGDAVGLDPRPAFAHLIAADGEGT
jgi:iron(III) transport system ATP-binding protein